MRVFEVWYWCLVLVYVVFDVFFLFVVVVGYEFELVWVVVPYVENCFVMYYLVG